MGHIVSDGDYKSENITTNSLREGMSLKTGKLDS